MKAYLLIGTACAFAAASPLLAAGKMADASGQDRACLISFGSAADANAGADATALSGKYLPRKAADAQAAQSGGKARVFDYSNTTQTPTGGTSMMIATNDEERAFCEGPTFNPSQR